MKTAILLVSFLTLFSVSANWFSAPVNCHLLSGAEASCEVCNYNSYAPIYCHLSAKAQSSYGFWMTNFVEGTIYQGQCAWVQVYANNPYQDPLVHSTANANCRY